MSNENKILYKELSYKLQGLFYSIRNELGSGHKESIYQRALANELENAGIKFKKEPAIKIYSTKGQFLGLYRPDFLIEDKIIVELKAATFVTKQESARVYDYLRNSKYELAYLVNLASAKIYIRRFIFTNDRKNNPRIATNNRNKLRRIRWHSLIILVVAICGLFVGIRGVEGAELDLTVQTNQIEVNQLFRVDLTLDTENEAINTVSGKVIYPKEFFELKEINDGNTIINFWVDKPRITTNGGTNSNEVVFSGIIPGGFNGKDGVIFSMIFLAKQAGNSEIFINEAKSFLHDGLGTETKTSVHNLFVAIRDDIRGDSWISPEDKEPPESFVPEIARDQTLFDGKWFLVFATQDKGSGISHYEVKESRQWVRFENWLPFVKYFRRHSWIRAESPYILQDQELRSYVFVKAIDKAGNTRVMKILPQKPLRWYENYENWIMIIIIVLSIQYLVYRVWKTRRHGH